MEPPCLCPGPGFCSRYAIDQDDYSHGVCSGKGSLIGGTWRPCPPEKSEAYRRRWRLALEKSGGCTVKSPQPQLAPTAQASPQPVAAPSPPAPAGGPGTELKKLLASLGLSAASGCGCQDRSRQMDTWGVGGCRENRDAILSWLKDEQKKRGWWEKAKAVVAAVTTGAAFTFLDPADVAGSLLDEALRRAETQSSLSKVADAGTPFTSK